MLRLAVFVDHELGQGINRLDHYEDEIINRANIGLDDAGYKTLWNARYQHDPLVLPAGRRPQAARLLSPARQRCVGRPRAKRQHPRSSAREWRGTRR